MPEKRPAEKQFSENVDRLIAGQEVRDVPETDLDLKSALDFARLIKHRQPQPSPRFQAELQARLLEKLEQSQNESPATWFQRLWPRLIPHQPVWQAALAVLVILIIGGAVLGVIWGNRTTSPVAQVVVTPGPQSTTAATGTTTATLTTTTTALASATSTVTATTTAATTPVATTPSSFLNVHLSATASTDKTVYRPGEPVVIEVELRNSGSQALVLTHFPPILSIMAQAGQPVLTFLAGQKGYTLGAGESITFRQNWDQKDARQRAVAAGRYHLELEDLDFDGQSYPLDLSQPVSFEITP
jgi:hypothetical protein